MFRTICCHVCTCSFLQLMSSACVVSVLIQALFRSEENNHISTLLVSGPWGSSLDWNSNQNLWKIGLNLVNNQAFEWKNQAKNCTNKTKHAETHFFQMFIMILFEVQSQNFHDFFEFQPWLNYLSPCARIIFACEILVKFTNHQLRGLLLCASDITDLQGGCMILW